jgi:hypothetical protein
VLLNQCRKHMKQFFDMFDALGIPREDIPKLAGGGFQSAQDALSAASAVRTKTMTEAGSTAFDEEETGGSTAAAVAAAASSSSASASTSWRPHTSSGERRSAAEAMLGKPPSARKAVKRPSDSGIPPTTPTRPSTASRSPSPASDASTRADRFLSRMAKLERSKERHRQQAADDFLRKVTGQASIGGVGLTREPPASVMSRPDVSVSESKLSSSPIGMLPRRNPDGVATLDATPDASLDVGTRLHEAAEKRRRRKEQATAAAGWVTYSSSSRTRGARASSDASSGSESEAEWAAPLLRQSSMG